MGIVLMKFADPNGDMVYINPEEGAGLGVLQGSTIILFKSGERGVVAGHVDDVAKTLMETK